MQYRYGLIIRFLVIICAVATAYNLYIYFIQPKLLYNLCLTDSNTCVKIGYWSYMNSALIHMEPAGYWIWFNGNKAWIYDSGLDGRTCEKQPGETGNFTPAYNLNLKSGLPHSYECIETLDEIQALYESHNAQKQYIYSRISPDRLGISHKNALPSWKERDITHLPKFNALDVLNLLADKNIINLKNI
jgi:hypothetical protein